MKSKANPPRMSMVLWLLLCSGIGALAAALLLRKAVPEFLKAWSTALGGIAGASANLLWEGARLSSPNSATIARPPGSFLSRLAEFLLSPKTNERIVNPIISDLQLEYCSALAAKRRVKAAWVCFRGYWSLFKAVGLYSIIKILVDMWRKVSSV